MGVSFTYSYKDIGGIMTLTKAELVKMLIEEQDFEKDVAKVFVDDFFEEMSKTLENGDDVKLSGFGNFELRDKKSRPGRNPKTGESVPVSARRVITFKPGQKLRARVKDSIPNN